MTVLSVDEARALIDAPQTDAQLTDIITREESWLARAIDQLAGPRTQSFWVSPTDADSMLLLRRPTDSVAVSDGGIALNMSNLRLLDKGTTIERILGYWVATTDRQLGPVQVTYTPNDTDEIKRVLISLVRMTVTDTGFDSEKIGDYQYNRPPSGEAEIRRSLVRSLRAHPGPKSTALRSSVKPDRVASRTWSSWWP